jgi:EAL domain-containing protein (putative c-di-GMP-specific phosphodiesterase class I)/GGDEF domain-containing protein
MVAERVPFAILARRAAIALLFVSLACLLHWQAAGLLPVTIIAGAVALGWLGSAWRHDQRLWLLSRRLEAMSAAGREEEIADRLAENAASVELALSTMKRRLSERHSISGLPTREPLLELMARERVGMIGAIEIADFDRLAGFNPDLAEYVLTAIVRRIARMLPPGRFVAHVDRAQFAIWYGEDVAVDAARGEVDALVYALGSVITAGTQDIVPTISARCAALEASDSPHTLLAQTLASFAIIRDGGGSFDLTPAAIAQEEFRFGIEQDLRGAVGRGEFELLFQPLINATWQCVTGAEALIRWNHPERGTVSPSVFIPVVEDAGLADDVGLWVLNGAAREASQWAEIGPGPLQVAVNISANQLHSAKFTEFLGRMFHNHGLDPSALEIELTETVASANDARVAKMFDEIRALGVKISIDDFGTGYSSFSTLRQLGFDKIKIDREFVTEVQNRPESQAICRSILTLGQGLGIKVLAEGVETAAEYQWLLRHGCRHFQGFYFSKPLPAADFLDFVRDAPRLADMLRIAPAGLQPERLTA